MSDDTEDEYGLGVLSTFDFFDAFSLGALGSVRMTCSFLLATTGTDGEAIPIIGCCTIGGTRGATGVAVFLLRDLGFGFGFVGGGTELT